MTNADRIIAACHTALDAGPATISLAATGRYSTAWTNMATTFKTDDIYVRIAQNGGDNVATPAILYAWVEFR